MTPLLVIGYGNELRSDDTVGPRVARAVVGWGRMGTNGIAVHQLTPELAALLGETSVVVFVDAYGESEGGEVRLRPLEAGPSAALGHTSDPRWLLALAEALYGRRPEAWLLTIPAADFGLGRRLSPAAQAGARSALRQIRRLASSLDRTTGAARHA
jgi:hydrogenase maturation protease